MFKTFQQIHKKFTLVPHQMWQAPDQEELVRNHALQRRGLQEERWGLQVSISPMFYMKFYARRSQKCKKCS